MRRFPNGSVLYDDSPWIIEIALLAFGAALSVGVWRLLSEHQPAYLMAGLLSIFVAICIAGMLSQQHRTFYFDPSIATMRWKTRGLFGGSSGAPVQGHHGRYRRDIRWRSDNVSGHADNAGRLHASHAGIRG
jgi:hypothetical protein